MRITGGRYRSRTLEAPRGDATRPTSDRVREALFAILGSVLDLAEARVLDLYAGTGALAFEALSRGAARATVVEPGRAAGRAILANARSLDVVGSVKLVPTTVERAGKAVRDSGPFDVVFADPPYADVTSGAAPRAIDTLLGALRRACCSPHAVLVLEHGKADAPPDPGRSPGARDPPLRRHVSVLLCSPALRGGRADPPAKDDESAGSACIVATSARAWSRADPNDELTPPLPCRPRPCAGPRSTPGPGGT